jgi:c-di-GMP-binding flagellar brake protein YcgR
MEEVESPMAQVERRGAVRIPAKLAMEIRISDVDTARVESINVSANGVYFTSPKFIPELTKLDITLDLPEDARKAEEDKNLHGDSVVCSGVVVRTEPSEEQAGAEYEIACYFTSIENSDKETLESYILKQVAF